MFEYVKELITAASSRIRSPIIGSIIGAFVFINWKEFFFLLFADVPVQTRLNFFEVNTDKYSLLYYPLAIGVSFALLLPWINLLGAFTSVIPLRLQRFLQDGEGQKRRIYAIELDAEEERARAKLEAAEERRKIDAAIRLREASSVSSELEEEISEDRVSQAGKAENDLDDFPDLDEIDWSILVFASDYSNGKFAIEQNVLRPNLLKPSPRMVVGDGHRGAKLLRRAVEYLRTLDYINIITEDKFELTLLGYKAMDYFRDNPDLASEIDVLPVEELIDVQNI